MTASSTCCLTSHDAYLVSSHASMHSTINLIKSSVVQLFGLYPSMGPEVVWDSQVKKKKKKKKKKKRKGKKKKERKKKKIPGDAVVAWENKQLSRQLKKGKTLDRSPGKEEGGGVYRDAW